MASKIFSYQFATASGRMIGGVQIGADTEEEADKEFRRQCGDDATILRRLSWNNEIWLSNDGYDPDDWNDLFEVKDDNSSD